MDCRETSERLDAYLDAELPAVEDEAVRSHLDECPACRDELVSLELLAGRLDEYAVATQVVAPDRLWTSIEHRLAASTAKPPTGRMLRLFRRPLAMAASLLLLIGGGVLVSVVLDRGVPSAQAADIDYSLLMNGITGDVHGAINRFLKHYAAEPVSVARTRELTPDLSFNLPAELPGGYRFVQAYRVQFGHSRGIAANYDRAGEPVFLIFHSTKDNTRNGSSMTCMVGGLCGSQMEVPPWRLLHMMDDTTCHCVLTTMEPGKMLESLVHAVAPNLAPPASHHH